ncbi:BTAD domain-containing putative transcriptional regulator [Plantactinospora sp. GCM10030261]|uniref:AfsR/SARP family transcriptional regulator n=1 Tax=Plantactinospora sp. GCM10030261 TaxID=3273420 RepID=UPI003614D6DF
MRPVDGSGELRLCLLGRVRLWQDGTELPVGPPQRRAVLALLALAEGQPVGRDELVDALWPTDPPPTVSNVVQTHVKHLRRLLEPDRPARASSRLLPSVGTGYRLAVGPSMVDLDLMRFRERVAEVRVAIGTGDHSRIGEATRRALDLWQPPLADLPALGAHPRVAALTAEAQLLLSWHVDAAIRSGRAEDVLALVREQARSRPLDEQAQAQLMRCYLAVGRRSEAFAVYEDTRKRLVDELGVDPGTVLVEAHRDVLEPERITAPAGTPASAPVPAQLPPDTPAFTGRVGPLRWLDDLLDIRSDGAPLVAVVTGTAGVGKTTLAVHWTHRVADRFPDGQLYADLRGFDAGVGPMRSDEVARSFLATLGVSPDRIPADLTAQVGLYRSLLAGRRMLILLDNARLADQVRPLLPGSAGCLVLVTSRNQLPGLVAAGARPLDLDLMTSTEARQMLISRIGSERVGREPEAIGQLAAACARLPLALAIVAARASTQPQLPLAALSSQIRAGDGDLTAFADEDEAFDVRVVFSSSYRVLSAEAAALFRMLGLHPGPDIAITAAAALVDVPVHKVRPSLAQLARAHLVVEHRPGRFGCHDLLRAYAAELVREVDPEPVRRDALRRMLDHYVAWAATADRLISPYRHPGPAPSRPGSGSGDADGTPEAPAPDEAGPPGDADAAFAWFATEHPALLALIDQAIEAGLNREVCELAWHLTSFLDRRGYWHDQAAVQRIALTAADRLGDRALQARTHRGLARAYTRLGRHEDAGRELRQALDRFEALGDDAGRANTEMSLADSCERRGHHREALTHAQRALALYEGAGYRPGQANALNAVGWCHALLGDHARALTYCTRALRLHQRLGDRRGAADTWDSIGYANHGLARYGPAARCFQRAVLLFREVGDRFAEAMSLLRLGDTHQAAGDADAGRVGWSQALEILTELNDPRAAEARRRLADHR